MRRGGTRSRSPRPACAWRSSSGSFFPGNDWPDFHAAVFGVRVAGGPLQRLVQVLHLDDRGAADLLRVLDEGPLGDQPLAAPLANGGGGAGGLQHRPALHDAGLHHLHPVRVVPGVQGLPLGVREPVVGRLVAVDQQEVAHRTPLPGEEMTYKCPCRSTPGRTPKSTSPPSSATSMAACSAPWYGNWAISTRPRTPSRRPSWSPSSSGPGRERP